jgi:DNA-directed RNA polymerase specialized sigma24 family protein
MATKKEPLRLDPDKSMAGILALLAAQREDALSESEEPRKTEVILSGAGLAATEIAELTGKNAGTVRKSLERSCRRAPRRKRK